MTASFRTCTSSTLTYPQTYVNSSSQTPLMLGYASDDKVIIKVSLHWNDACDAEMAKRTKGPSSANGNEAVKQQEVKVKPEEVNVKPEVNP